MCIRDRFLYGISLISKESLISGVGGVFVSIEVYFVPMGGCVRVRERDLTKERQNNVKKERKNTFKRP